MASGPITLWQVEGEKVEEVTVFLSSSRALKSHWCWLQAWNQKAIASWQESYDKSGQCVKNQRHHFGKRANLDKAVVFPVVTYGCESWTIKKAEHHRIDTFQMWCYRRLLRVPWTARSNQSALREINPEYSLEGMMLKLKLQCFGHLIRTDNSLEKSLMLGKIEGRRRRGR